LFLNLVYKEKVVMRKVAIILMSLVLTIFLMGTTLQVEAEETAKPMPPGASQEAPPPPPPSYNKVGDPLPPMTIKMSNRDGTLDLAKIKKPSVFMFANSACSACRTEIALLSKMAEKMKDKIDWYIVVVDFDPTGFAKRLGNPAYEKIFVFLDDSKYEFAETLGFRSTPSTLVSNSSGKQAWRTAGFGRGDENMLAQEIIKNAK
jgi:thiol-disulfide isomerase/thioredoxin